VEESQPLLLPLGDCGLLVRFGTSLSDAANRRAVAFARRLRLSLPAGVTEIDPNLVSVLLKFHPKHTSFEALAGEVRLLLSAPSAEDELPPRHWTIPIRFGGATGPDLAETAAALDLDIDEFISRHNALPLRILTTGFAPGFVYCGFHPEGLKLPRRPTVRPPVPPGSVLFAAGQTAIASTPIPTGWHVIGITDFRNFDPAANPPTKLREGDFVRFTRAL
jgi:KipI family sensor histidine kinase inhibitor